MTNPFDFFDKIFFINLDRREDRLNSCIDQFNKYGLTSNVERFSAINLTYSNGSNDKLLARAGCTLSHFEICKIAKKENLQNYLVLEDDFEFCLDKENVYKILNQAIKELPNNWDMLYIGGNLTNEYGFNPIEKYTDGLFKLNACHTTHAMALNSCFYDSFLDDCPTEESIIDWCFNNEIIDVFLSKKILHKYKCFITKELIALQSSGFSDIEKNSFDYRNWLISSFELFKKQIQ